jgi:hypothetical protein
MNKSIKIKINTETGEMVTEAFGFKGKTCMKETEKLIEGLGAKQTAQKLKPEWTIVETTNKNILQT